MGKKRIMHGLICLVWKLVSVNSFSNGLDEISKDNSFETFHDNRCQCHWPKIILEGRGFLATSVPRPSTLMERTVGQMTTGTMSGTG